MTHLILLSVYSVKPDVVVNLFMQTQMAHLILLSIIQSNQMAHLILLPIYSVIISNTFNFIANLFSYHK